MSALLEVRDLKVHFPVYSSGLFRRVTGHVQAVDGLSFDIAPGEILGLVGESGCGKSTTGRAILRLVEPTAGQVLFDGQDVGQLSGEAMRKLRREMQIIFQDPYASLNPRMTVGDIITEPLSTHGLVSGKTEQMRRAQELMEQTGLDPRFVRRYPHEFSGGQRQRIGIARALASEPRLIVCDEPISALDVSIQAQILNLLQELARDRGLSYLFIAHDLSAIRHICDRIAVMYLGRIVEIGTYAQICDNPEHPYTQALVSAVPVPDPVKERERHRIVLTGDVPSPLNPPAGCRFHTRCHKHIESACKTDVPELKTLGDGRRAACHFVD
ncbi:MAG: ATP-binding cassette domain-containing protein [Proteobacteria bacterium]|nr:ATP-binding cassette domain-containing protein [Pseudomonadota bacterium]MCP4915580.1 ATP-binding cassette domain-containing protein [Pseudomonadota bacterium]